MKNGKKIGIGLGIGGVLLAAAGAALTFVFGKKKNNECIECSDTDDTVDTDFEEVTTEE